jgi:hypothetical protein
MENKVYLFVTFDDAIYMAAADIRIKGDNDV